MSSSSFKLINDHTAVREAEGVSVRLKNYFNLEYKDKTGSVRLKMDTGFAFDLILTFIVSLPKGISWRESKRPLTREDFERVTENVRNALKLFNALTLFVEEKAPQAPLLMIDGGAHVN